MNLFILIFIVLIIILQNLLSNAIKYTSDKGKVTIKIFTDKDKFYITVGNNGKSIPEADKENIFKKLFRTSNAQEQDPDGNGLGLYLVSEIIKNESQVKLIIEHLKQKREVKIIQEIKRVSNN